MTRAEAYLHADLPSFILIHPTVWPQYTNVTDRQDRETDRQRSYSIGRTVLETVAQKKQIETGVDNAQIRTEGYRPGDTDRGEHGGGLLTVSPVVLAAGWCGRRGR